MGFKKGYVPWNKGKTIQDDIRIEKLRTKTSGGKQLRDVQFKKNNIPWNKGKPGYTTSRKGQVHTEEAKKKMSENRKDKALGIRNGNWKNGGCQTERHQEMGRWRYREWRESIFTRDDYICQICQKRGGKLEADHIKPWALYPDSRYDINNGRTLCQSCHRKTSTWGGKILKMNFKNEGGEKKIVFNDF